jgi:hypothetical protein
LSRVDDLLQRLPAHFNKEKGSNNYKLLTIIAEQSEENERLYDAVIKFWDVDQSEGMGLDRLGKDEGIHRGSYDDETYRKMIKIQYIINLSEGDITSINAILRAYLGESYLFTEEGWVQHNEPASFYVNVSSIGKEFPFALLKRIKSAGVRAHAKLFVENTNNLFVGGILHEWKTAELNPVTFHMPNIKGTEQAMGYVSTWQRATINTEVKHKWLITRVLS